MAVEKKGLSPWANACAGQARNQRMSELSPQPQVVVVVGWPDQTFHQTRTESARYPAAARSTSPRPVPAATTRPLHPLHLPGRAGVGGGGPWHGRSLGHVQDPAHRADPSTQSGTDSGRGSVAAAPVAHALMAAVGTTSGALSLGTDDQTHAAWW